MTPRGVGGMVNALSKLNAALVAAALALIDAHEAADALAYSLRQPAFRRALREYELGYRVPDWVAGVWEQQREQFGTGNGRTVREGWVEGSGG